MRNPLNAIYQSADLLSESFNNIHQELFKIRDEYLPTATSLIKDPKLLAHFMEFLETELSMDVESLESLTLCATHQKRIADDVLQMSKLSLNLVYLNEAQFDPLVETKDAIRMFEREAFVKGIAFTFSLGDGYRV